MQKRQPKNASVKPVDDGSVLYYCLSVCAFRQARGAQEKRRRFVQSRPMAYKGTSRSDLDERKTKIIEKRREPKGPDIRNSASASVLSCRNAVVAFYIIVFRSAPFGKRVGRRKKGEDLFKADRRRTKVRRGRIWTKERQK